MILLEIKEQIAFVTLNRPDKQNALSYSMFKQLDEIAKKLKKNKSIRLVVIQGKGNHFCSGIDVKHVFKQPSALFKILFKWLPGNANLAQRMSLNWHMLPVPVIALIEGNCFGGGLHIALGADIRIAHSNSKLAIMEAKWGLCPDMGTGMILPSLMEYDKLLKLSMLASPIDAQQALQYNLISHVTDDLEKACDELIAKLINKSPDTLAAIKRVNQVPLLANKRQILASETWAQIRLMLNKNTKIASYNALNEQPKPYHDRKKW
jgi:enoyl-CoA hydratase/carnithine racemase